MNERTLHTLEYDKIKQMLVHKCLSQGGRELADNLQPVIEYDTAEMLLEQTAEAEAILLRTGSSPVSEFAEIIPSVRRAELGAVLSMPELLGIADFLRGARKLKKALEHEESKQSVLDAVVFAITARRDVEDEIFRCIAAPDEMDDSASAALSEIRREMRRANEKIRDRLNGYIRNPESAKLLQEPIVTIRGDRYVLPVRCENKGAVPGIVHDQSSSGATLFIEPLAVVELNNEIRILAGREAEEIQRILSVLSAMVSQAADCIAASYEAACKLDFIFAKAKLSREMNAIKPKLNTCGYINIKNGRHPLIKKDKVVPISVWLGRDFTVLLITGPNTGGKTVTLKTIGLFQLMAQSGLQVPCDCGSELTVFDAIYADIGDEQSIEQSLSTFSSHMTNIADIMRKCDGKSLVLFDELGAGTDPNEGASLAMAILERLIQYGTRTVATTHYSELKAYSLTTAGIENASVEFDASTLRPTYKLSVGVPGASNAFLISRRLGLDEGIIVRASELMDGEQIRFESVLQKAEQHKRMAQQENEKALKLRMDTEKIRMDTQRLQEELHAQQDAIIAKARVQAKKILENADLKAQEYIDELKALKDNCSDEALIRMQTLRKGMKSELLEKQSIKTDKDLKSLDPSAIRPGMTVYVRSLAQNAEVCSAPNAKGEVKIQAGVIRMDVKVSDITVAPQQEKKKKSKTGISRDAAAVPMSLDVRGKTVEEALLDIDRYLEEAAYAGFSEVTVIHGKGTGALRAGLRRELKNHPRIKSMRDGRYGEGENGVTVIELK